MNRRTLLCSKFLILLLFTVFASFTLAKGSKHQSIAISLKSQVFKIPIPSDVMPAPKPLYLKLQARESHALTLLAFLVAQDQKHPGRIDPCRCKAVVISTKSGKNAANQAIFSVVTATLKAKLKKATNDQASQAKTNGADVVKSGKPIIFMDKPDVFAWYRPSTLPNPNTGKKLTIMAGSVVMLTHGVMVFVDPHYTIFKSSKNESEKAIAWVKKTSLSLVHSIEKAHNELKPGTD